MGTFVLDNGAYTAKCGFSTELEPRIVPSCISKAKNERRTSFIGDQLNDCKDFSGIFYVLPFQKGYLINWDVQRQLWDYIFSKDCLNVDCADANLVLTEPVFNFTSIKECMDEIFLEEYRFNALHRTTAPQLSSYKCRQENKEKRLCCLVVDTGFSFTHIVPIYDGKIVKKGIKRVNVGGKLLTNHLKDIISYRQLHVLDETYVMNQVKEDCCYVSNQFYKDMEIARKRGSKNSIIRDYILPDYTNVKRGFIRPVEELCQKYRGTEQLLIMNNERFAVPELLFHPTDIGIKEMGISEAIIESITSTPLAMQPHLFMNIVLTGGNSLFPGYRERVTNDVRSMAPIDFDVEIHYPENPISYAWKGGAALSHSADFIEKYSVTRAEYEEHGRYICCKKFEGIE